MYDHWTDKATTILAKMGAPGADPGPLAEFGREWKAERDAWIEAHPDTAYPGVAGVLITPGGMIVGETENVDGTYRLTRGTARRHGAQRTVLDMGVGAVQRSCGEPVVHITGRDLSLSGGSESPILGEIRRAVRERDAADERVTELMKTARAWGVPIARIGEAAGLRSRQTIYNRLGK